MHCMPMLLSLADTLRGKQKKCGELWIYPQAWTLRMTVGENTTAKG